MKLLGFIDFTLNRCNVVFSNRKWANFSITGSSNALEFDSLSIKNIFELPVHAKLLTSALKLETGVENIVLQQFSVKFIMSHNL